MSTASFTGFLREGKRIFNPTITAITVINAYFYDIQYYTSVGLYGGAAICFELPKGTASIKQCEFSHCIASDGYGGAIKIKADGNHEIKNCLFTGNEGHFGSSMSCNGLKIVHENIIYTAPHKHLGISNYHFYFSSETSSKEINMTSSSMSKGGFLVYANNNSVLENFNIFNQTSKSAALIAVTQSAQSRGIFFKNFNFVRNKAEIVLSSYNVYGNAFINSVFVENMFDSIINNETNTDVRFESCITDNETYFTKDDKLTRASLSISNNAPTYKLVAPVIGEHVHTEYAGVSKQVTEAGNAHSYTISRSTFVDISSEKPGAAISILGPNMQVYIVDSIFNNVQSNSYLNENDGGAIAVSFYDGSFSMSKSCATNCFSYKNAFAAVSYVNAGRIAINDSSVASCANTILCHSTLELTKDGFINKLNFTNNFAEKAVKMNGAIKSSQIQSNTGSDNIIKIDKGILEKCNIISNKAETIISFTGELNGCVFIKNECKRQFYDVFDCKITDCVFDSVEQKLISEYNLTVNDKATQLPLEFKSCPIISQQNNSSSAKTFFKSTPGIIVIVAIVVIAIAAVIISVILCRRKAKKNEFITSDNLSAQLL